MSNEIKNEKVNQLETIIGKMGKENLNIYNNKNYLVKYDKKIYSKGVNLNYLYVDTDDDRYDF
jgi:hypothetical protein